VSFRPTRFAIALLLPVLPLALARAAESAPAHPDTALYPMPRVEVVGRRDQLGRIPGSASVLDARALAQSRVLTTSEALRKLPGLTVRDEEGLGLRPNVGARGLNPTRSTKTTLLEDGVPLAYAPYGDNASYYHPPVERFEEVELLKGAGQVGFGPQTIGGLLNYITPTPPSDFRGSVAASGGSREHTSGRLRLGGYRVLLDVVRRHDDGARENMDSRLDDVNFKTVLARSLTLRANFYRESSMLTYSGLTQAEFENLGPRYNPFRNDEFDGWRLGASATHRWLARPNALLVTNLYASYFDRDWWRQSSTTTDGQGGAAVRDARLAGTRLDPDAIASVQGRLREYTTWGLEPRLRLTWAALGLGHELNVGLRAHFERQDRRQVNGASATARTGALVEDNLRETDAWSAFASNRVPFGSVSVTPGLRYEHIRSSRTNRLPGGRSGSDRLGTWIPSLGATWAASKAMTVYAGVHRGFAPPRTEDVIGSAGTATDVEPEESVNWELGTRFAAGPGEAQATLFRNDFRRLIAVGSIAGGSTPLAQGEALFMGAELSGRVRHASGLYVRTAWTWLPEAEQSTAFRQVVGGAVVSGSAAGNRQPYAPEHLLTVAAGFERGALDAQFEAQHTSTQFADFANTVAPSADGQRGKLSATTVWNATFNHDLPGLGATVWVAVKNLADLVHVVDRTRGIQVGMPRTFQAGVRCGFGGR
jgi:Fe(3+) dicitrate transport protein